MKLPWGDYIRATVFIAFLVIGPLAYAVSLVMYGQYLLAMVMVAGAAVVAIWLYVTARVGYRDAMKSWRKETGIA